MPIGKCDNLKKELARLSWLETLRHGIVKESPKRRLASGVVGRGPAVAGWGRAGLERGCEMPQRMRETKGLIIKIQNHNICISDYWVFLI